VFHKPFAFREINDTALVVMFICIDYKPGGTEVEKAKSTAPSGGKVRLHLFGRSVGLT
jgi:hypothetical protein